MARKIRVIDNTPMKLNNIYVSSQISGEYVKKQRDYKELGFDTLQSDLEYLGTVIKDVYSGWQKDSTMKTIKSAIQSMNNRLTTLQEYRKEYGITGDEEDEKGFNELVEGYKQTLDGWDELTTEYGQYKSSKEYYDAVEERKKAEREEKAMATADLSKVRIQIDKLKSDLDTAKKMHKEWEIPVVGMFDEATTKKTGRITYYNNPQAQKLAEQARDNTIKQEFGYSIEELEEKYSKEEAKYKRAESLQSALKLVKDARSDVNYDAWSQEGMSYSPKDVGMDETYYTASADGMSLVPERVVSDTRQAANVMEKFLNGEDMQKLRNKTEFGDSYGNYVFMNEDEFKIFAFYLKYDKENNSSEAEKYLASLEETLNDREASTIAQEYEDSSTLSKVLYGFGAGLDQFASGIRNAFNTTDDYIPTTSTQFAAQKIRRGMYDEWADLPDWMGGGSLGQAAFDTAQSIGNMAPSIAAGAVSNFVVPGSGVYVSSALMGTSAHGNAYQEMLNQGYSKTQSRTYATLVGVSEATLNYFLNGVMGGKATEKAIETAIKGIDKGFLRFAVRWGMSGASEIPEEFLQSVLDPVFQNIAVGYELNDMSEFDWSQAVYEGLLGGFSGLLLGGGRSATSTISEQGAWRNAGKNIRTNNIIPNVLDIAKLTPQDSDAYQTYTRYVMKGINADNITAIQIGRLYCEINTYFKNKVENDSKARLLELGIDQKMAKELAPVVAKAVFGEQLTSQEHETLKNNKTATQVVKELSADRANTIWKDAIKNSRINNVAENNAVTEQGDVLQSNADSVVDGDIAATQHNENSKLQSNKKNNIINSVGDNFVNKEADNESVREIREKYFRKIGDDFQGGISETAETFSERTRRNSLEGSGKERLLLNEGKLIIAYTPVKDDNSPKHIFFKKLRERGIDIYYCDGVIETNVDGITLVHNQAITTRGGKIFVSSVATVEFKSMMDHELVHWKMRMFSDSYFEYEDIVLRNLNRESNYYIAFCEELNLREYNNRYDINTIEGAITLNSEITAYVYQYVLNDSNFAENFFSKMFFDWHNVKNAVKRFNSKMEINTELFNQVGSYDESAFFAYKNKIENNTTEQGEVLQSTADGVVDNVADNTVAQQGGQVDAAEGVGAVQSDSNGVAAPGVVEGADGKQYFDDGSGDEHFGEHEISYLSESDVISSFDIKRMNDTIHVQEKVFETLLDEGFFEDFNERKTLVKNKSSGMIIEINKSGIRETFNYHNFTQMPHEIMMDKLLLIRNLPLIIRNGKIIEDNVKNIHSPKTSVSYAYIVQTVRINGVEKVATVVIRKSPQKNKFWTLQIDIKNNIGSTPAGISQNSITGLLTSNVNTSLSHNSQNVNIEDVSNDLNLTEPTIADITRAPTAEEAIEEAITGKQKTNIQRHIVDIGKKLFPNITIEFVNKIDEKGKINGVLIRSQNKILIKSNLNAVQMYVEVFKHEFMHRLETKRLYSKFFNYCFKKSKAFEQYVRAELNASGFEIDAATRESALQDYTNYKYEQYKNDKDIPQKDRDAFTMEMAREEIIADFFAQILFQGKQYRARIIEALENADGEMLIGIGDEVSSEAALMELQQKEPTLYEQVKQWLRDIIDKLRGMPQAKSIVSDLEYIEGLLTRVYNSKDSKRLMKKKLSEEKYLIAGEKSQTANHSLLFEAQLRAYKGEDSESIRRDTGWYKGRDGKWRYYIPDNELNIDRLIDFANSDEDVALLGDVIVHDKLFAAYPELRKLNICFEDMGQTKRGKFLLDKNEIVLNAKLKSNGEKIKDTLVHEIQHAIQYIEGFARGGNKNFGFVYAMNMAYDEAKNTSEFNMLKTKEEKYYYLLSAAQRIFDAQNPDELQYKAYRAIYGEVEARQVTRNRLFDDELLRYATPDIQGNVVDKKSESTKFVENFTEMGYTEKEILKFFRGVTSDESRSVGNIEKRSGIDKEKSKFRKRNIFWTESGTDAVRRMDEGGARNDGRGVRSSISPLGGISGRGSSVDSDIIVEKNMGVRGVNQKTGFYYAINKKMSSSQYLADLNEIRKAYVQDVKENYSNFIIPNSFGNVNIEGNNGASLDQYSLSSPLQEFKNNNEFELSEPDIDNIEISDEVEFFVGLNGVKLSKTQKHIIDICKNLASNITVEFVDNLKTNGKFIRSQNKIIIRSDLSAVQMYVEVFKHEFMHRLETKALYSKFFNYCFKKSKAFEQYVRAETKLIGNNNVDDMARESVLNLYTEYKYNQYINDKNIPQKDRDAFTKENAQEEIVADFFAQILFQGKQYRARIIEALENADGESLIGIGDEISSEAALMELKQKEPTLLEQVVQWIKDVIDKLRGIPQAKSLVEQLDNEINMLESMARRAYQSKDSKRLMKKKLADEKYSIINLDTGKSYVQASRQVIRGNSVADWRSQISEFFNKSLKNGPIEITTIEGDILTISKDTANKARDKHISENGVTRELTDKEFLVKLNAEAHIDELAEISVSKKDKNENKKIVPDNKNHDIAKDGFTYRTVYFQDFDDAYYRVTLSVGENNGISTVYNVGKIKADDIPNGNIVSAIGSKADMSSTKYSILNPTKKVKQKDVFGFKINENADINEDLLEEVSYYHPEAEVDEQGNITVYHRTTKENATIIKQTGIMTAKEDALFFSSKESGYASDYGDTVVKFKIPSTELQVNDIFDGEVHFDLPLKYKNGGYSLDVSKYLIESNDTPSGQYSLGSPIQQMRYNPEAYAKHLNRKYQSKADKDMVAKKIKQIVAQDNKSAKAQEDTRQKVYDRDGNLVGELTLKEKDMRLFDKTKKYISDLFDKVSGLRHKYKSFNPDSKEGKVVTQMTDTIEQLHRLWEDAAMTALENSRRASGTEQQKNTAENGGEVKQSQRLGGYYPDIKVSTKDISIFGIKDINDLKEVKYRVYNYLLGKYVSNDKISKPIKNIDTGMDIYVYKGGIDETFGNTNAYKNLYTKNKKIKLATMTSLAKLIKYGEVRSPEAFNLHNPKSKNTYAYLTAPIVVDDITYTVNMDIKKTQHGNRFYVHTIKIASDSPRSDNSQTKYSNRSHNEVDVEVPGAKSTSLLKKSISKSSIRNPESNVKQKQLEIIQQTNQMWDDYHTGIRTTDDIHTWAEVLRLDDEREGQFVWGDFSRADAEKALKDGTITVYSSYPIKNGVFVSSSYIQAQEYAGGRNGKVYSKTIPLTDVAWINGDEGQYAEIKVSNENELSRSTPGDNIKYSVRENFYTEFDQWVADGRKDTNVRFVVGTTSEALKSIGMKDQEIILRSGTVNQKLNKHTELTTDIFRNIPDLLENPVIVQFSDAKDPKTNKPKFDTRITILGELYAEMLINGNKENRPVLVSLELLPTNQKNTTVLDFSIITSAYGHSKLQHYLNENSILYIDPNKKRTNKWLSLNRLQLPLGETKYGSIRKITYSGNKVKIQNSNNKTAMETALEKAGVVDEFGNAKKSLRDPAFVSDRDTSKPINSWEKQEIEKICNKFDIDIVFEDLRDMVHKGEILSPDGYIGSDGVIHINTYAENPVGFILKHELTHFGEKSSRYIEFVKTVKKSKLYKKWITEKTGESDLKIAEYKYKQAVANAHSDIYGAADPKAQAEMIADFVGENLFTENGSGLVALTKNMDTKQRSAVVQFVIDFISYIKKKISGQKFMTLQLSIIEDSFNRMLSDASQVSNDCVYSYGDGVSFCFAPCNDEDQIAVAEKLEAEGKDCYDIFMQCGLIKDAYGKWKYELNTSGIKIFTSGNAKTESHYINNKIFKPGGVLQGKLSDFIYYKKLFEAFPQTKDVKVIVRNLDTDVAGFYIDRYDNDIPVIVLDKKFCDEYDVHKPSELKTALLREIQHVIQYYSGERSGTSLEQWELLEEKGKTPYSQELGRNLTAKEAYNYSADNYEAAVVEKREKFKDYYIKNKFVNTQKAENMVLYAPDFDRTKAIITDEDGNYVIVKDYETAKTQPSIVDEDVEAVDVAEEDLPDDDSLKSTSIETIDADMENTHKLISVLMNARGNDFFNAEQLRTITAGNDGFLSNVAENSKQFAKYYNAEKIKDLCDIKLSKHDTAGRVLGDEIQERFKNTFLKNEDGKIVSLYMLEMHGVGGFAHAQLGVEAGTLESVSQLYSKYNKKSSDDRKFNIQEVIINMTNPLVLDYTPFELSIAGLHNLVERGILYYSEWLNLINLKTSKITKYKGYVTSQIRESIKEAGYDGIIYYNDSTDAGSMTVVAFDEDQILTVAENGVLLENNGISESQIDLNELENNNITLRNSKEIRLFSSDLKYQNRKLHRIPSEKIRAGNSGFIESETSVQEEAYKNLREALTNNANKDLSGKDTVEREQKKGITNNFNNTVFQDENGNLLSLFAFLPHNTINNNTTFGTLNSAIKTFIANKEELKYARFGTICEVYINSINPFVVKADEYDGKIIAEQLLSEGKITQKEYYNLIPKNPAYKTKIKNKLDAKGYDSVIMVNGNGEYAVLPLDESQIVAVASNGMINDDIDVIQVNDIGYEHNKDYDDGSIFINRDMKAPVDLSKIKDVLSVEADNTMKMKILTKVLMCGNDSAIDYTNEYKAGSSGALEKSELNPWRARYIIEAIATRDLSNITIGDTDTAGRPISEYKKNLLRESKFVDHLGRPYSVFIGNRYGNTRFKHSNIGLRVGTLNAAHDITVAESKLKFKKNNIVFEEYYPIVKNPYFIMFEPNNMTAAELAKYMYAEGLLNDKQYNIALSKRGAHSPAYNTISSKYLIKRLKQFDFDCIAFMNEQYDPGSIGLILFDGSQLIPVSHDGLPIENSDRTLADSDNEPAFFMPENNGENFVEKSQMESVENVDENGIIEETVDNDTGVPGEYTYEIVWQGRKVPARRDGKGHRGPRTKQHKERVNNYELKLNPDNESYFLDHPDGKTVQFENMKNGIVQDCKLVMNKHSIYYVKEKIPVLNKKILKQAIRQLEAANSVGYKVEWLVSDQKAVDQMIELFNENDLDIIVTYYPE